MWIDQLLFLSARWAASLLYLLQWTWQWPAATGGPWEDVAAAARVYRPRNHPWHRLDAVSQPRSERTGDVGTGSRANATWLEWAGGTRGECLARLSSRSGICLSAAPRIEAISTDRLDSIRNAGGVCQNGELTHGLRAVVAPHLTFHLTASGIRAATEAILAGAEAEAIFAQADH